MNIDHAVSSCLTSISLDVFLTSFRHSPALLLSPSRINDRVKLDQWDGVSWQRFNLKERFQQHRQITGHIFERATLSQRFDLEVPGVENKLRPVLIPHFSEWQC